MHTQIGTLIPTLEQFILAFPPTGMFWGSGRKPEKPDESHIDTANVPRISKQTVTRTADPGAWFSLIVTYGKRQDACDVIFIKEEPGTLTRI